MSRFVRVAALLLASAALVACGGGGDITPPPPDNTPASITLTPSTPTTLISGATSTIAAVVKNKSGSSVSASPVWTTGDASIAQVSSGLVTASKVGTTTITATAGTATASVSVTVTPGTAAALAIRTQPAGAVIGSALGTQPILEIRDAAGNVVTTSTASVTASIASGGGTLGGTTTVAVSVGVAAFSNLSISGAAGDRTLAFTSAGLSGATSSSFTMTPPPVPVIVLDSSSILFTTPRGANPAAATLRITNGGTAPLTGLTVDPIVYDAGQPTGWLTASLNATSAPATLTLTPTALTLASGSYHAVVPIVGPGATNSPASVSVTLTVFAGTVVSYGSSAEKVKVVDISTTFSPTIAVTDSLGQALIGVPVTYTSRASSIATVGADGRITARGAGDAWIVAASPASVDSIFVIVPKSATAPIMRTNTTTWLSRVGDTTVVTVVLDTRGVPVGAASMSVGVQLAPAVWSTILFSAAPGPPVPVVNNSTGDIIRVSVGAASGMTGVVPLLTLKLVGRTPGLSGWLTLLALDVSAVDASDITAQVTSTRLPISVR